jgi:hypothetical protein
VAADGRTVTVAPWYLLEDTGRVLLGLDAKRARLRHMRMDPRGVPDRAVEGGLGHARERAGPRCLHRR